MVTTRDKPPAAGFLLALQDKTGEGKADVIERFGETTQSGGAGGTGIGLYNGSVYAEISDRIVSYAIPAGSIVPSGPEVTVVTGLPLGGDHPMHPFTITADGSLYVDVSTATNSCQFKNRTLKSPGSDPCAELETRGGIWLFDARKTSQPFTPANRYATGIRNGEGFAVDAAAKRIFVTQHGRDQLHSNWPDLYKLEEEATLPPWCVSACRHWLHSQTGGSETHRVPWLARRFLPPCPGPAAGVSTTFAPRKRMSFRRSTLNVSAIVTTSGYKIEFCAGVRNNRLAHAKTHISRKNARYPDFLHAALDTTACAPFFEERSMKFPEPRRYTGNPWYGAPGAVVILRND